MESLFKTTTISWLHCIIEQATVLTDSCASTLLTPTNAGFTVQITGQLPRDAQFSSTERDPDKNTVKMEAHWIIILSIYLCARI